MEINYAICWIVIYPLGSAIQRLNNRGQQINCVCSTQFMFRLVPLETTSFVSIGSSFSL